MKTKLLSPVLALVGLSLSGCNVIGITCPLIGSDAIIVEIRDAATGAPAAAGATLIVRQGTYADTVQGGPAASATLSAASERAGTYDVLVRKPGYQDWTQENVTVRRAGACDRLDPVRLQAELQPVGAA